MIELTQKLNGNATTRAGTPICYLKIINQLKITVMLTQEFYKFTKNFVESDKEAIKRGAEAYINASRTHSLCCVVKSVSKPGLS